jgi:dTMP kinase
MRGLFLAIEGLDKAGKTTLSYLLVKELLSSGKRVVRFKFPKLKGLTYPEERKLFQKTIMSLLMDGYIVIADRWIHSGLAYSRGLEDNDGIMLPDFVIYLDIKPEQAKLRNNYGDHPYEIIEFQRIVYVEYETLRGDNWLIFDAMRPTENICAELMEALDDFSIHNTEPSWFQSPCTRPS